MTHLLCALLPRVLGPGPGQRRVSFRLGSARMGHVKAAQLLVRCLEAEGVEHVFGIPGEETLDLNLALEDSRVGFGSIVWKQERAFGRHFGTSFDNPDFVALAGAFGLPAWRVEHPDDLYGHIIKALALDVPSLIAVPVDYSVDVAIVPELGEETTPT